MGAPVVLGERADEEVRDVLRPVAAAHDLPVEKADLVAGEHVRVADVRIAVEQGHRPVRQRVHVARPQRDDLVTGVLRHVVGNQPRARSSPVGTRCFNPTCQPFVGFQVLTQRSFGCVRIEKPQYRLWRRAKLRIPSATWWTRIGRVASRGSAPAR